MNYELKGLALEDEGVSTKTAENYFHNKGYRLMPPADYYNSEEPMIDRSTVMWTVFIPNNPPDNYIYDDLMSYYYQLKEEDLKILLEGLYDEKEKDPYKDLMI